MSGHTPGPWVVRARKVTTEGGAGVAGPIVGELGYFQASSNLNLIAAAPDLLESLLAMVEIMDCGDEHGAGSDWHTKAKAAIAKATGEAT